MNLYTLACLIYSTRLMISMIEYLGVLIWKCSLIWYLRVGLLRKGDTFNWNPILETYSDFKFLVHSSFSAWHHVLSIFHYPRGFTAICPLLPPPYSPWFLVSNLPLFLTKTTTIAVSKNISQTKETSQLGWHWLSFVICSFQVLLLILNSLYTVNEFLLSLFTGCK